LLLPTGRRRGGVTRRGGVVHDKTAYFLGLEREGSCYADSMNPAQPVLRAAPMLHRIKRYFQDSPYPDDFWAKVLWIHHILFSFLFVFALSIIYLLIFSKNDTSTAARVLIFLFDITTILSISMLTSSLFLLIKTLKNQQRELYVISSLITAIIIVPTILFFCIFWQYLKFWST
jgi:hypothetical protein